MYMCATIKTKRLNYARFNRKKLRADNYIKLKYVTGKQDIHADQLRTVFYYNYILLVVFDICMKKLKTELYMFALMEALFCLLNLLILTGRKFKNLYCLNRNNNTILI